MKWNKLAALFVLAVFVTSILPFAAAEDGGVEDDVEVETRADSNVGKRNVESREDVKTRADEKRAELMAKRTEARAKIDAKRASMRERFEAKRTEHKMRKELYQQLKEKRNELKDAREAKRAALGEIRGELRNCIASDSEECQKTRANARAHAKGFLTTASEHIIAVLQKARERIENSDMGADAKATALAEIDAALAEIDAAQEAVASLGDDATREDLKDAAQIIREASHKAQKGIKKGIGIVASKRIGGVIVKMERLSDKFERMIAHLEKKGKDTSAAEAKQVEFEAKLDAAEALHAEAKALFESGDHAGAAEKIRAAHAELKAAHEMLKALVHEIRGIGGTEELEDASEESEEESDADDAEDTAAASADTDESDETSSDSGEGGTDAGASTETNVDVDAGTDGASVDADTSVQVNA